MLLQLRAAGGDESTVGSGEGTAGKALAFEVEHRLAVYPEVEWFDARLVRVTNKSGATMRVRGCFFYTLSSIGGEAGDDVTVPVMQNYYMNHCNLWRDPTDLAYGVMAEAGGEVLVNFYVDEAGGQHPDAQLRFERPVSIGPLQGYVRSGGPAVHILGTREEGEAAGLPLLLMEKIRRRYAAEVYVFGAESFRGKGR